MKKLTIFVLFTISSIVSLNAEVLSLQKLRDRIYSPVKLSMEFRQQIQKETKGMDEMDIVQYCYNKTQELLTFSTKCENFDDKKKTKMHCVGYARVFSTICNYALSTNGFKGFAKPVIGHVYLNGMNLNDFSKMLPKKWKNFTKDHDFAEVTLSDGSKIYVDPSLNIIQR